MFLDEVHRAQRQEIGQKSEIGIGIGGKGRQTGTGGQSDASDTNATMGGGGAGDSHGFNGEISCEGEHSKIFLVENVRTKLQCSHQNVSGHFSREKTLEAKMLWGLIGLVDRENNPLPATAQASGRKKSLEAASPPWVLGGKDVGAFGPSLLSADAVWSRLQEAASWKGDCLDPPCAKVGIYLYGVDITRGLDMCRRRLSALPRCPLRLYPRHLTFST